jgi:hypothetical protein
VRYIALILGFVLFLSWLAAFLVYHVVAAAVHLLLVFALVLIVVYLFSYRRTV